LKDGLQSVALSANWMWPCRNEGEDARLYEAVKGCSDFAIALGIAIPTGKDSLSMKQQYPDKEVIAPGTVIISAVAHCDAVTGTVEPVFRKGGGSVYYINLSRDDFKLGGSSFGQLVNAVGREVPTVKDAAAFKNAFKAIQKLIKSGRIIAGHDVASGGLITTLLELCFAENGLGAEIDLSVLGEADPVKVLFAENAGIVFQGEDAHVEAVLNENNVAFYTIGKVTDGDLLRIKNGKDVFEFNIPGLRDVWYTTSYLLDVRQSGKAKAEERFRKYKNQPLRYTFPEGFDGKRPVIGVDKPKVKAAVLREKGSNSEREMANALHLAGFEVKDVHMTDLLSGRETLEDIRFIGAVGGFSNSDVLGSAKGWAGAFLYNEGAGRALENFFNRSDTLSLGICNGCQLFLELGLLHRGHVEKPKMRHNDSHKFECVFTSVDIQPNTSVM
ncbi:MAG: phosphoribosylformylglycinamidine synthase subunit PurQ, partial [Sinomicrobium sp.]|nr:phosphoribosylformylglycinamidine synthase subunit PurQ [Sinomicrobium sp.]